MSINKHYYLEELHREMNPVDIAICDLEVTRPSRTSCENNSVKLGLEVLNFDVDTDVNSRNEGLVRSVRI